MTAVKDPRVLALPAKVRYRIDPQNPYPNEFTGHIRATLADGSVVEERQPHFRGGAKEPLTRADIEEKFALNCRHGGWDEARTKTALQLAKSLYDGRIDLKELTVSEQELSGRVALVTGAGRNIGRAMAKALAAGGAAVVVNVRSNRAEAEQVVREIERDGGKAIAAVADVGDEQAVYAMVADAAKQLGRIDYLINNAALRQRAHLRGDELQGMARRARRHARRRVPLRQGVPAVPEGRAAPARSSTSAGLSAHTGSKHRAHVTTAKLGLVGFTRGLAHDLAPTIVTVNLVAPGTIDTRARCRAPRSPRIT